MCLYIGLNKHKVAQEDIVCYKVITRSRYRCLTFYQKHPIYSGVPLIPRDLTSVPEMDEKTELSGEVVHAFQTNNLPEVYLAYLVNSIILFNTYAVNVMRDLALMECIIPKGTVYYENICNDLSKLDGIPQYGATRIIPVKIVKYYTDFVEEYK